MHFDLECVINLDLNDFNNTIIRLVFEADESLVINDMDAAVAIFDDPINEATEQAFVVQLKLISSIDPELVDLTLRPASLCRIVDNDREQTAIYSYYLCILSLLFFIHCNMQQSGLDLSSLAIHFLNRKLRKSLISFFFQSLVYPSMALSILPRRTM